MSHYAPLNFFLLLIFGSFFFFIANEGAWERPMFCDAEKHGQKRRKISKAKQLSLSRRLGKHLMAKSRGGFLIFHLFVQKKKYIYIQNNTNGQVTGH